MELTVTHDPHTRPADRQPAPARPAGVVAPVADPVNHPTHYQSDSGVECIDAIRAALGLDGFVAHCRGCAIKYSWRTGKKDRAEQELRKAAWYLNRAADEIAKAGEVAP